MLVMAKILRLIFDNQPDNRLCRLEVAICPCCQRDFTRMMRRHPIDYVGREVSIEKEPRDKPLSKLPKGRRKRSR